MNRNKITAGRMNNDAKDCKASLELARVYIGIANSSSTGSSIIPAIECMMVVGATNCTRNSLIACSEKERCTKTPPKFIYALVVLLDGGRIGEV